jgi:hypothetical protein
MSRRRRGRWGALGVALLCFLTLGTGVVSAHGVAGSRFDAPLPRWLLAIGAGEAVVLTVLWLLVADHPRQPTKYAVATVDARTVRWLRTGARVTFLCLVVAAVVLGVVGPAAPAENLATVFTWPLWVHGLGLVAMLAGSPWPALAPWRFLYVGLCRLGGTQLTVLTDYPSWLGVWPALGGFLALLGVIDTLTIIPRTPTLTALAIAGYGLVMIGGAVLVGPAWFQRADPLGVLSRLYGRVACVSTARSRNGGLAVAFRPPWQGCTAPASGTAVVVFILAIASTVSFDSFTRTALYEPVFVGVRDALGTGSPTGVLLYGVGLAVFLGAFLIAVGIGERLGTSADTPTEATTDGGERARHAPARAFAPPLLPVVAGAALAHSYPYVLQNAARLAEILLLAAGIEVGPLEPLGWLSVPGFWASQIVVLVAGHVVAVVAAHHVAVERYPTPATARRGIAPLVVLLVGYTVLSLVFISELVAV